MVNRLKFDERIRRFQFLEILLNLAVYLILAILPLDEGQSNSFQSGNCHRIRVGRAGGLAN